MGHDVRNISCFMKPAFMKAQEKGQRSALGVRVFYEVKGKEIWILECAQFDTGDTDRVTLHVRSVSNPVC